MPAPTTAGRTALIVEDEPFTRTVLVRVLTGMGFERVRQAEDGEAGLALVRDWSPGFVLCDVEMEPMNGLVFVGRLRRLQALGRIPVVLMTNRLDPTVAAAAEELSVTAVMPKPVTPADLVNVLEQVFGTA